MKDHLFNFLHKYKYHFLIWSLYIAYEVLIIKLFTGKITAIEIIIFYNTFNISLFYIHANILLKYTLDSRSKLLKFSLVFLVLIEIALFISIKYGCEIIFFTYVQHIDISKAYANFTELVKQVWRPVYFIGFSTGYYFLMRTRRQSQLVEEMEQQELENVIQEKEIKNELVLTQNAFLRSQINPDFLIKTLSYLYDETRESAPKAAESILSLSDIMQYALSKEASSGFVELEKEINLIEKFLLLHQARHVQRAALKFSYNNASLSISFIPLVLMTLTENILKHGQLDDPQKPAEIKITCKNSILRITTSNYESSKNQIPSHGIGLKNIKKRLYLAYGETASFNYYLDSKKYFHTTIEVQI